MVTLYFPHSAAAATLYIEAVPSMSRGLKTSFSSVHGQKIPGVPKALCIAMACTTKSLVPQSQPLEMLMDSYSCVTLTLDLPFLLSHSQSLALGDTVKAMSNYHIIIVIMQIKVVVRIHQINGQTAHNTCEKRMKTKVGGMWKRHNHPFLPL